MRSYRAVAALAIVALAGVVAVASGATSRGNTPQAEVYYTGPVAHAAGGSAGTPTLPDIVNVKMVRAQAGLDRASALIDGGVAAPIDLAAVRSNMNRAWLGEKYLIQTAPPPPVGDSSYPAHTSGSGGG